jgi:hypothetical protein
MKLNKNILIIISSAVILSACQKENIDIFLPDNNQGIDTNWVASVDPSMPVSLLKSDLAIPAYIDTIEITNSSTDVISSSGLQCLFPENCLIDSDNLPVRGKISMQTILMQKKGDMIRLNKSTESNGYVIASSGMFMINLKKDEGLVKITSQSKLNIHYRDSQHIPLIKLFYGTDAGQGLVNWNVNKDLFNNITLFNEGYEINTGKLGWVNAGYVIDSNTSQNISLKIQLAKHFTNANTLAWLVFKNHRSVVNLQASIVNKEFSHTDIPVNQEATIVVISRQLNDYYLGSENIITSPGGSNMQSVPVTPVKTSFDALLQYLNSL